LLEVLNPATEEVIESLEAATVDEADAAIARAREAFPAWRNVRPDDRSRLLRRLADALDAEQENLARLESKNTGKPIGDSRGEMAMVAETSQISYTASKGGVLALSRELGVEFARRGIRVNALCPGPVNTPLLQEIFAKDPEKAERRLVHLPMGRFAEATEIAGAVLFLASEDASYVNASTFLVDGGLSGAYVTPE
jgi:hypothetical protein